MRPVIRQSGENVEQGMAGQGPIGITSIIAVEGRSIVAAEVQIDLADDPARLDDDLPGGPYGAASREEMMADTRRSSQPSGSITNAFLPLVRRGCSGESRASEHRTRTRHHRHPTRGAMID